MKNRFAQMAIRRKFFVTMFLSSLLALLVLTVGACIVFASYYLRFESASSSNQLGYIGQQIEFFQLSVSNYSKTIRTEDAIQQILSDYRGQPDNYGYSAAVYANDQLHHIIQSTSFIHSVTVYGLDGTILVSTDTVPYNRHTGIFSDLADQRWVAAEKVVNDLSASHIQVLSYFTPCYNISSGKALGYVEISVPESAISSIYSPYITDAFHVFIADSGGVIQSHPDAGMIGSRYRLFDRLRLGGGVSRDFIDGSVVFARYYPTLDWYLVNQVSISGFFVSLRSVTLLFLLITAVCMLLSLLASRRISATVTSPLRQLVRHTATIRQGNWTSIDAGIATDRDTRILFEAFNEMIESQEALKNALLETEKRQAILSLSSLQQQVNPHFLYNTLDNIASLTELGESSTALEMVLSLSSFYRESLSRGSFIVSIREELQITESYLRIMQIRKYNRFSFAIDCPQSMMDYRIPKLLLQPVVENSIEHGFGDWPEQGRIDITVEEGEGDGIVICVRDNGRGLCGQPPDPEQEDAPEHYGLSNVNRRIRLYYGAPCGLQIAGGPQSGCVTTIAIRKGGVGDGKL